ncbi:DUF4192 family protein [Microbacterium sp. NPDC089189]|uniref:DUF4192 family protein n=1 Tax=Microbacterium sp. NPDC089189 TaxID=3154972 RepID=UPI0034476B4C
MTTIIKAGTAADFLSLVPSMLGFTPTRSLVLVPFADNRSIGVMRVDLPSAGADLDAVASTLIGMLCRVRACDGYVAVVYDADPPAAHPTPADLPPADRGRGGPPHAALLSALTARADACGLRVVDALFVGASRWQSYLDPAAGAPVADLPATDAAPPVPDGDQHTGAVLPSADLAERERVGTALRELDRAIRWLAPTADAAAHAEEGTRIHPTAIASTLLLEDVPHLFDSFVRDASPIDDPVRAGGGNTPADAARHSAYASAALIWCLARPALRDIGLATWVRGIDAGDDAVEAQQRWEDGAEYPADLAAWMTGEGARPDPERLTAALAQCRLAAALAPREARPGALSVCAWLAWALGRSSHAGAYTDLAREIDPEHGLSCIVASMVAASYLPDWAFVPPDARRRRIT